MPVYTYKCPQCNKSIDVRTDLDKADLPQHCPKCKIAMRKQQGFGGVTFKGTGFYTTDK